MNVQNVTTSIQLIINSIAHHGNRNHSKSRMNNSCLFVYCCMITSQHDDMELSAELYSQCTKEKLILKIRSVFLEMQKTSKESFHATDNIDEMRGRRRVMWAGGGGRSTAHTRRARRGGELWL